MYFVSEVISIKNNCKKKSNKLTICVFMLELEDDANMQFNFGLILLAFSKTPQS
jgi:hypothetical protein